MTEEKLEQILTMLKSINKKLQAQNIVNELKAEETDVEIKAKKLPKSTKKLKAGAYTIAKNKDGSPKLCNQCYSYISWDDYPKRKTPIHVDEEGHIKGTGDCPNYTGGG